MVPSQSNQILTTPLRDFVAHIKVIHANCRDSLNLKYCCLCYRTRTVFQMELINIQVKFFSFIHISTDYCFLPTHIFFFPVYSVFPSSLLSFTMEKILASEFTLSLSFSALFKSMFI